MITLPGTLESWPCQFLGGHDSDSWTSRGALPNLSDPATIGCLLALVREAWGDPLLGLYPVKMVDPSKPWWNVANLWGNFAGTGPAESEALVSALEAAP
jgi:hypothetical protein